MESIVTPVNVPAYKALMEEANYDADEIAFLVDGFQNGFSLQYQRKTHVRQFSPNLKLNSKEEVKVVCNKVMKEVEAKRYVGPFTSPPFEYFIQSPIGLVPKDRGKDYRLIFHLFYLRNINPPKSVNANIPEIIYMVVIVKCVLA